MRLRTLTDLLRRNPGDPWSAPRSGEYVPCQLRTDSRKATQ